LTNPPYPYCQLWPKKMMIEDDFHIRVFYWLPSRYLLNTEMQKSITREKRLKQLLQKTNNMMQISITRANSSVYKVGFICKSTLFLRALNCFFSNNVHWIVNAEIYKIWLNATWCSQVEAQYAIFEWIQLTQISLHVINMQLRQKKKTNPRHLEDCSIDVETKHGTYMSYTSINIGHRAHRLFPFLECKCGAHFILMFTADKWIKMKTVPLYRKMHPISNECKRKNHVQVLGSHNKGSVKGVTCK